MYVAINFWFVIIATMNIFITGINEGCGKTLVAAGISAVMQSLGYKTGVYKPVQTGALDKGNYLLSPDLAFVNNIDSHIITHSTYLLTSLSTPAAASKLENVDIQIEDIENDYKVLSDNTEILITEGNGGLLTPVNNNFYNGYIPLTLKIPVVFVVTPSNDSVNTYLNELNTAHKLGLDVIGVIINKLPSYSRNSEITTFVSVIEQFGDAKILGIIHNFKDKNIKTDELFTEILNGINLQEILRMEIPKLNF